MSALKYWVWLSTVSGVGPVTAAKLLKRFGTPEGIYSANASELRDVEGLKPADITHLMHKDIDEANKILASCAGAGCRAITLHDPEYPERLSNIYDPPIVLYVCGVLPEIDEEPVVAIVGTRDCTPYGIAAAKNAGYTLAKAGFIVVTGLARGVDSTATQGALSGGGRVLGVIGSGLDIVYPPENKALFDDVASSGAILSEYPPGTPAVASHFPARNRILSGLSLGVAVIEAPKRSGALITAARALEQGRDVFSLPGNVDARSCEGSNALLREGAIPFLSGEDIISEYAELFPDKIIIEPDLPEPRASRAEPHDNQPRRSGTDIRNDDKKVIDNIHEVDYIGLDKILSALDGDEGIVARAIGRAALHADEIINITELPATRVLPALTMLEIKKCAICDGSGKWRIWNSEVNLNGKR